MIHTLEPAEEGTMPDSLLKLSAVLAAEVLFKLNKNLTALVILLPVTMEETAALGIPLTLMPVEDMTIAISQPMSNAVSVEAANLLLRCHQ